MIRCFDIAISLTGLLLASPLFVILFVIIPFENYGSPLFFQERIGKNLKPFKLVKFRTMVINAHKEGLLTTSQNDKRITRVGQFLRKYKIDEIPQLINVLTGSMSIVGPRPEVANYVKLYTPHQLRVLSVRPGITDKASIKYHNENELLAKHQHPEEYYINTILPDKIAISLGELNPGIGKYLSVIYHTFCQIIKF